MSLRNGCFAVCLLVVVGLTLGAAGAEPAKQTLPRLTYAQLGQFVHDNQGKVVYVDFWQFSCVPCKKSLPDLARLQLKYGPKGFLAVAVNLDDPKDVKLTQSVLGFVGREELHLKSLTHLQLNETQEAWARMLGFDSLPRGYLFDRKGRLVHKSDEALQYDSLAKDIEELLERK